MKIGVISDTHIPVNAQKLPETVKTAFKDVAMIIHAGDLVCESVIVELKKITNKVEVVCGNMDSSEMRSKFPEKKVITVGKYKIGITHGYGAAGNIKDRVLKEFKNVDIIVFGHSHKPINEQKNGVLLFNPGSPTDNIFAPFQSVGILELDKGKKGTIIKI